MKTALYPGSFDPFTIGHKSIVERALGLFDKVVVGVGHNLLKPGFLPIEARLDIIRHTFAGNPRVDVEAYTGLTADFAHHVGADCLLRGIRSVADFEKECDLADVNREISGLETVVLYALPQYAMVSSSMIRELHAFGKDVNRWLPAGIHLNEYTDKKDQNRI